MLGANVNKKGKIEKNQKIREGPCIFPFKHQWKEHNECIDNKDKGKICATSVTERGTLKTYGYCTPEQPDRNTHSISKSNNNRVKKGTKKKAPRKKRTLKIVERFPSRSKSRSKSKSATVSPKIQVIGEAVKDKDIKILPKSKSMSKSKSKSMSKSMNNELIDIMDELADIMLRQGEPFKARAYKRASETIMSFPEDIVNVDQLEGKPAIGKTIMEKMIEFQKTGTLRV